MRLMLERLLSCGACFIAIFIVTETTQSFNTFFHFEQIQPVLLASMGASSSILFFMPHSPFAQPWAFFAGHLIASMIGISCAYYIPNLAISTACAVSGSILVMLLCRCFHPPACATSLALTTTHANYYAILSPVFINIFVMLVFAFALNRWCLKRNYPHSFKPIVLADENSLPKQDLTKSS